MIELKTAYLKELDQKIRDDKEFIARGRCTSFEDYKGRCESLVTLEEARITFNEIFDKFYRNDEDLDYEDEAT